MEPTELLRVPVNAAIGETWKLDVSSPKDVTLKISTSGGTVIEVRVARGSQVAITSGVDAHRIGFVMTMSDPERDSLRLVS